MLVQTMMRLTSRMRRGGFDPLRIVRASGLFDADWYLQQYPDVRASGMDPLVHYLKFGTVENRSPNPYFDAPKYLENNPDVAEAGTNPLVHYILWGAAEGRPAGPAFDTRSYLEANPDVRAAGMNPLRHFIHHGRHEGRTSAKPRISSRPPIPEWSAFTSLAQKRRGRAAANVPRDATRVIDIIVPVYRGLDDTLACIHSVLCCTAKTPFELVVIDDASPDPELSKALRKLANLELITLLVNETNKGFVQTVNRGMALHGDRDVVLLNSDTVVYNDWLDRLIGHASQSSVATVTPFSNNATICSYPRFNVDNTSVLEIDYSELDQIAAEGNQGQSIEVPTGVGFCMYIARHALESVGAFDAERFGKGYGEENDFCARAARHGLLNLLALDVFVRHTGKVSFGSSSNEACIRAQGILHELHPDYHRSVQKHLAQDEALGARRQLDVIRLLRQVGADANTLCFTHTLGGGIKRYLRDRARHDRKKGRGIVVACARSLTDLDHQLGFNSIDEIDVPNLAGALPRFLDDDGLAVARALKIDAIEVHSLVGYPSSALRQIPQFARRLGIAYQVMLHDYVPICPQINLIDTSKLYCGEQGVDQCRACLSEMPERSWTVHGPSPFVEQKGPSPRPIDILTWRSEYGEFLRNASKVSAPSHDTARRFRKYFPQIQIEVVPHQEAAAPATAFAPAAYDAAGPLRVAVIGAIGPPKGSHVLREMAADALRRRLPLEIVIVGYTDNDEKFRDLANVRITGAYEEAEVFDVLARQKCHIAFLPSVWPETYCYTFSIACAAGLPTVVLDVGAPSERAKTQQGAIVVPFGLAKQPARLNDRLLEIGRQLCEQAPVLADAV